MPCSAKANRNRNQRGIPKRLWRRFGKSIQNGTQNVLRIGRQIVHCDTPYCYWFALLIFLVVKKRTGGAEIGGDKIEQQGKLWYYKLGGHSADEGGVPNHEYERTLKDLKVSNIRDFV